MGDLECLKVGRGHINGLQNPNVPTQEPVHYNFPNPGQATTTGANGRHAPNTGGLIKGLVQTSSADNLNLPDQTGGPEKIHVLQTKHANSHTTYFAQQEPKKDGFNANGPPEKIHDLIPEAYRTQANNEEYPSQRTTFYAQEDPEVTR